MPASPLPMKLYTCPDIDGAILRGEGCIHKIKGDSSDKFEHSQLAKWMVPP